MLVLGRCGQDAGGSHGVEAGVDEDQDQRQEQQAHDRAEARRVLFGRGISVAQQFRNGEHQLLAGPQAEEVGGDVPGGDGGDEAGDQDQPDVGVEEGAAETGPGCGGRKMCITEKAPAAGRP